MRGEGRGERGMTGREVGEREDRNGEESRGRGDREGGRERR